MDLSNVYVHVCVYEYVRVVPVFTVSKSDLGRRSKTGMS